MKVTQLGNGGGFDYNKVNSSFLVELNSKETFLVDCGYNIFTELRKIENDGYDLTKIKYVCITHHHSDHFGSLEIFCQYMYFVHNVTMTVFIPSYMRDMFEEFKVNKGYTSSMETDIDIVKVNVLRPSETYLQGKIRVIGTNHPGTKSLGYSIGDGNSCVFISGDTKAFFRIEDFVNELPYKNKLIFHDYSDWNVPSKNVHCCQSDFEAEYSKEFRDKVIKYHTGKEFIREREI